MTLQEIKAHFCPPYDKYTHGVVYQLVFSETRSYIGSSTIPVQRIDQHLKQLVRGNHTNKKMQKDFNAHPEMNIKLVTLCFINLDKLKSQTLLREMEMRFIKIYKPKYNKCFNISYEN